jgi:hypothetical protein
LHDPVGLAVLVLLRNGDAKDFLLPENGPATVYPMRLKIVREFPTEFRPQLTPYIGPIDLPKNVDML